MEKSILKSIRPPCANLASKTSTSYVILLLLFMSGYEEYFSVEWEHSVLGMDISHNCGGFPLHIC